MVTNLDLNSFGFESIEEYFQCILDEKNKNNQKDARFLYSELSLEQRIKFLKWFDSSAYYDMFDNELLTIRGVLDLFEYLNEKNVNKIINKTFA